MKNEIIRFLADHYHGVMVSDRVFFSLAGYCATAQIRNGSVVISVELPSLAESIEALNEVTEHCPLPCEYTAPALYITPSDSDPEKITQVLDRIGALLCDKSIPTELCVLCKKSTDSKYNLNGYYVPLHKECANLLLAENTAQKKSSPSCRIRGFIVGTAFGVFGAAFYILYAYLGIMPALGGITMGLFAALGFNMFNKSLTKADKFIFAAIFFVLAASFNFAADAVYAAHIGKKLDFMATYTEPLNLFNTLFDIIAGIIIAVSSMAIVFDFNRSVDGYRIRKLPTALSESSGTASDSNSSKTVKKGS